VHDSKVGAPLHRAAIATLLVQTSSVSQVSTYTHAIPIHRPEPHTALGLAAVAGLLEEVGGMPVVLKNPLTFQDPAAELEAGRRVPIGAGQAQTLGSLATISTGRKDDSKHDEQELAGKGG
jgi:hypothetical protein